jgi:hypothetical protein
MDPAPEGNDSDLVASVLVLRMGDRFEGSTYSSEVLRQEQRLKSRYRHNEVRVVVVPRKDW